MNKKIKKAQELSRARCLSFKKAQEEFVGFALIVVIVSVIMLVFFSFTLNQPPTNLQSFEVVSFLQTTLQYTTDCRDNQEFLPVQKLISACAEKESCIDERDMCSVLNETLVDIIHESWGVGEDSPTKAYELKIIVEEQEILSLREGNITKNYKSALQDFSKSVNSVQIYFKAYS